MIDTLIYDFDGTLSDTYPVVTRALLRILKEHEIEESYEQAYAYLKISYRYAMEQYDIGLDIPSFRKLLEDYHIKAAMTEQKPLPGTQELLATAAKAGKRNFIYTHSGKFVHDIIDKWGFTPYVTFTLDSSYQFPRKPDPAALRYLTERFAIDPATALMVGDRDIDIEAGHNAGMAGCLFDPDGYYPACKAEYHVNQLSEIKKIIL